jgi:endonuclease
MTTMAQALREFVSSADAGVTSSEIRGHIANVYGDRWKPGTLDAHLYGCRVNSTKAYRSHPFAQKFLYKADDGRFHIYNEESHGPNVWTPAYDADEQEVERVIEQSDAVEELIEASVSFERDVEAHLIQNLAALEPGLRYVDRQVSIDVGRVDILAEDASARRVVIELKVGEAKDSAVGQIARYLGWYAKQDGTPPRGILIASEFSEPIRYAAQAVRNLELIAYKVQFAFSRTGSE